MESPQGHPRNWWLATLGLVILTWIVFLPIYDNRPVWDDWVNIVHNQEFRGLGFEQFQWAFTQFRMGHYQPLAWLSLGLDHALWGQNYGGYRLTNVVLHSINIVLFALVAFRLLALAVPKKPHIAGIGSLVAAATFALHPMRVETVAWLTERRHLLSASFVLAALLVYLWRVESQPNRRLSATPLGVITVLFAFSLLSTPLAIGFPLVLLVLDGYPLKRRPQVLEKTPLFLLGGVFVWTAFAAQHASEALVSASRYGIWERLVQASYSAAFYPRAVLATSWSPLYERPFRIELSESRFLFSMLALIAITAAVVLARKRAPAALAVWACYLILIAPFSGLAQSGVQLVADRYSYLAGLGFSLLLGAGAAWWWARSKRPRHRVAWALVLLTVLGFWGWSSYRQIGVWRNDDTLWAHVDRLGPSAMAHNNLGASDLRRGRFDEGVEHVRRAVEIAPTYGRAWVNLEKALERDGLEVDPPLLQSTIATLEAAIEYQADTATGWYILGLANFRAGKHEDAIQHFEKALGIKPDLAAARFRLGSAMMATGRPDDAAREFEEYLRLEPGNPKAIRWLEAARGSVGETP